MQTLTATSAVGARFRLTAAKSRRNPACPKADFQWRDRLDLDTRLLLNKRVDRQSNGSRLQIYASRMAESQALLA